MKMAIALLEQEIEYIETTLRGGWYSDPKKVRGELSELYDALNLLKEHRDK